ncbi:RdgB/HAM1 family non-canonical purine NTP pyrophosphatase [Treponema pectinovorum]|uniref:RdgB/HAM1 family non-canonical purine NTP pyrophosphatase n=1 Tax=Treponema pectinovorum TaxID=164 RepID=UPI0011C9DB21|nr:RdgB/HAM1 family non-canonical purine NTP pyrophosphatase [Treponema pectinovorum]
MRLFLASGNRHKQKEVQEILKDYEVLIPKDLGIDFDPVETGESFYENSLIKARSLWDLVHETVIADDSGICVEALNNAPGIYSARYAGPLYMKGYPDGHKITQEEQNNYLIQQLNDTESENRNCFYVCSMVLLFNPQKFFIAQETFEGKLIKDINEQAGSGGFGYDPIVYLPEYKKTVAELSADEKNKISHRGKALRQIATILNSIS